MQCDDDVLDEPLDDFMEDLFEAVPWEPSSTRTLVSTLLDHASDRLTGMHADGTRDVVPVAPPLWDPTSLSPENLLCRAAYEHHPDLYIKPERPRRLRRKGSPHSVGEMLFKLQACPLNPGLGIGNHSERKIAFEEYVRVYSRATGLPCVQVRAGLRAVWKDIPLIQQKGWYVISLVSKEMFEHVNGKLRALRPPPVSADFASDQSDCVVSHLPETFNVLGLLCTWNTRAGLDSLDLQYAKDHDLQGDDLLRHLLQSPVYLAVWQGFRQRIEALACCFGFGTWACCVEVSFKGTEFGRIHLHAFWGPRLAGGCWATSSLFRTVYTEQLRWDGNIPDVQTMRARGRPSDAQTTGGLYYVLCKKVGSLFRAGSVTPFEDLGSKCSCQSFQR